MHISGVLSNNSSLVQGYDLFMGVHCHKVSRRHQLFTGRFSEGVWTSGKMQCLIQFVSKMAGVKKQKEALQVGLNRGYRSIGRVTANAWSGVYFLAGLFRCQARTLPAFLATFPIGVNTPSKISAARVAQTVNFAQFAPAWCWAAIIYSHSINGRADIIMKL